MRRLFGVAALAVVLAGVPAAARAELIVFAATLSGPAEDPPNASPGTGFTTVRFDTIAHTMQVQVAFADLLGVTTASHIHAPTAAPFTGVAGVATQVPTFVDFPLGVSSGSYDHTFDTLDLATYNPAFVTANGGTAEGAEAALLSAMLEGRSYLNIHTDLFPRGEIRGFLRVVPEPGAITLMALGAALLGLPAVVRRRAPRR